MIDAIRLLDTPLIITPDMSELDLEQEWNAMVQRSILTQRLIDGLVDWEYFLDFMAQQGYEPTELLDCAEQNLEFVQTEGIGVEK